MRGDGESFASEWRFSGVDARPARADFALIAFLPMAMNLGRPIHVEGAVSRSLLEGLEECVEAWSLWRPDLFKRITIDAEEIVADQPPSRRDAAIAFSGGVDATFALAANKTRLLRHRSLDVRCGVLVHGFDVPLDRPEWFEKALPHAKAILDEFAVACVTVATDWRALSIDWEMTHGFALAAVLHQLASTYSCGMWAADEPYHEEVYPWGNNSVTNPLLSCVSFPIRASGGGYTRTEKAATIGAWQSVRQHIRVCWEHPELGGNCGDCEKCVRTQLNFMAAGYRDLEAFGSPLTPDKVRTIVCRNEVQRRYLQGILKEGRDKLPADITAALSEVAGKPTAPYRMTLRAHASRWVKQFTGRSK